MRMLRRSDGATNTTAPADSVREEAEEQMLRRSTRRPPPFLGPLIALVTLCIVLSVEEPFFYSKANILNVLTTNSPLMIVALGMTVAMISGGFDLSVGSSLAATGVVLQYTLTHGVPTVFCLLLALLTGTAIGAFVNGPLIAKLHLNFFVVTLGTMTAISGLVYVATNAQTRTIKSQVVYNIGNADVLGLPVPVLIIIVAFMLCLALLNLTPLGRNIYAVGGSHEAARLSGIRVPGIIIFVYAFCGMLASLAGIVEGGLLTAAAPDAGKNLALTAGAAVLLGGTSFSGGVGGATGTVVGVLLIAVLQNGLGLFGVWCFGLDVVTGGFLIAAVALDRFQRLGLGGRGWSQLMGARPKDA
jgi:ribose transport system permease protein